MSVFVENFMGRIDIERAADDAVNEPYVVIAQIDYEAPDCIQSVRVPFTLVDKLIEQLQAHQSKMLAAFNLSAGIKP